MSSILKVTNFEHLNRFPAYYISVVAEDVPVCVSGLINYRRASICFRADITLHPIKRGIDIYIATRF
jgi:hypothetical protein